MYFFDPLSPLSSTTTISAMVMINHCIFMYYFRCSMMMMTMMMALLVAVTHRLAICFVSPSDLEPQFREAVQASSRSSRWEGCGAPVCLLRGGVPAVPEGILWQDCGGYQVKCSQRRCGLSENTRAVFCGRTLSKPNKRGFLDRAMSDKSFVFWFLFSVLKGFSTVYFGDSE